MPRLVGMYGGLRGDVIVADGEFGTWASKDEELVARFLSGHKKTPSKTHGRRSNPGSPVGAAAVITRTSTNTLKRESTTRSRKSGNVYRVYSIGSCPTCKNGSISRCPTCGHDHPVQPV